MTQPRQSDSPAVERSEFGRGVAICLAKFSEHLSNRWAEVARITHWWASASDERRAEEIAEAIRHPRGDAARRQTMVDVLTLDEALHMWANGARDHFFDLDEEHSPPALRELAALVLEMGDVYPRRECVWADFERVYDLWERACVELDERIGVDRPDWGQW